MTGIVKTDGVLGGKAHLDGCRIAVLDVAERVLDHDHAPEYVADQLDIEISAVYTALAYYYEHIEAMNAARERRHELDAILEDRSKSPEAVEH